MLKRGGLESPAEGLLVTGLGKKRMLSLDLPACLEARDSDLNPSSLLELYVMKTHAHRNNFESVNLPPPVFAKRLPIRKMVGEGGGDRIVN